MMYFSKTKVVPVRFFSKLNFLNECTNHTCGGNSTPRRVINYRNKRVRGCDLFARGRAAPECEQIAPEDEFISIVNRPTRCAVFFKKLISLRLYDIPVPNRAISYFSHILCFLSRC